MIWLGIIIASVLFVLWSRYVYQKGWLAGYQQHVVDAEVEEHE